jgi:hypothetical protein
MSVRPILGVGRPQGSPTRLVLSPGGWQVGPQGSSRCMGWLKAVCSGCGPLNPCVRHVVAPDSSSLFPLDWWCQRSLAFCMAGSYWLRWRGLALWGGRIRCAFALFLILISCIQIYTTTCIKSPLLYMSSNLGFCNNFQNKICLAPNLILSDHSMCICPHQDITLPLIILLLMIAYVELKVGYEWQDILASIYCKVKKPDPREKQIIQSDQDVHLYGCDEYGKMYTRPRMGSRYYHTWWNTMVMVRWTLALE